MKSAGHSAYMSAAAEGSTVRHRLLARSVRPGQDHVKLRRSTGTVHINSGQFF